MEGCGVKGKRITSEEIACRKHQVEQKVIHLFLDEGLSEAMIAKRIRDESGFGYYSGKEITRRDVRSIGKKYGCEIPQRTDNSSSLAEVREKILQLCREGELDAWEIAKQVKLWARGNANPAWRNVSRFMVYEILREYSIKLPMYHPEVSQPRNPVRDSEIYSWRQQQPRPTYQRIAHIFGLSTERVRQVCDRESRRLSMEE